MTATKARTGSPTHNTPFLFVQSVKNPKSPAVDAPTETLAELDGPHVSGCLRLPESVRPQLIIGSSKPEIQATLVMVQDRLDITESEDEKQVSICHRGDVHAGKCPSILPTQLPSREELRLILKAAALPSASVLLAEGKRHGLNKEVASGARVGPGNLVRSSWIQCCVSHLKCL